MQIECLKCYSQFDSRFDLEKYQGFCYKPASDSKFKIRSRSNSESHSESKSKPEPETKFKHKLEPKTLH